MRSPARSTFVTVIGWIFAVLSGLGLLMSAMQNIMLHTVFPLEQMSADIPADMPPMAAFMFEHFALMFLVPLLIFGAVFAGSVGLLKRREWARKLMAVLMGLAALWSAGGILFQMAWMGQISSMAGPAPASFQAAQTFIMVFSLIWGLGFAALFGWITKRLLSWDIEQEFRGTTMD